MVELWWCWCWWWRGINGEQGWLEGRYLEGVRSSFAWRMRALSRVLELAGAPDLGSGSSAGAAAGSPSLDGFHVCFLLCFHRLSFYSTTPVPKHQPLCPFSFGANDGEFSSECPSSTHQPAPSTAHTDTAADVELHVMGRELLTSRWKKKELAAMNIAKQKYCIK